MLGSMIRTGYWIQTIVGLACALGLFAVAGSMVLRGDPAAQRTSYLVLAGMAALVVGLL